jgi:hypothetical protein
MCAFDSWKRRSIYKKKCLAEYSNLASDETKKDLLPWHMEILPNGLEYKTNDKSARHMKTLIMPDWLGKKRN